MRTWVLVVIGAALPLVLGASLGMITTTEGKGTWAYSMDPTAFLFLSIGLAVSHFLIVLGYLAVAVRIEQPASQLARLAAAGSALLVACELWSGLEARTDLDSGRLTALDTSYVVTSVLIVLGTAGAAIALKKGPFAVPLMVNAVCLAVAIPVKYLASDGAGIAVLTVWSLLYIPVALRLRTSQPAPVGSSS